MPGSRDEHRREQRHRRRRAKQPRGAAEAISYDDSEEVSSSEWQPIDITEQEEDIIRRMYRLVGDRWTIIAGRVPGRKPEEIERFWIMRNAEWFAYKRI